MDKDNGVDGFSPANKPWLVIAVAVILLAALAYKLTRPGKKTVQGQAPAAAQQAVETNDLPLSASRPVVSSTRPAPVVESRQPAPVRPAAATNAAPVAAVRLLEEGRQLEAKGMAAEAVEKYRQIIQHGAEKGVMAEAEQRAGKINIELIMSPAPMEEKKAYIAKSGDSPHKIAAAFGTTAELLQKSNGIQDASKLRAGDSLRVFTGRFSIVVNKNDNTLTLLINDTFFKKYPVATGKFDRTPAGTFKIVDKIVNPDWWRADKKIPYGDPENILGTRWLAIDATGETPKVKGYGIHGTTDESSIGKAESAGCIRMKNSDVEELFTMVPYGTAVTIMGK